MQFSPSGLTCSNDSFTLISKGNVNQQSLCNDVPGVSTIPQRHNFLLVYPTSNMVVVVHLMSKRRNLKVLSKGSDIFTLMRDRVCLVQLFLRPRS